MISAVDLILTVLAIVFAVGYIAVYLIDLATNCKRRNR